MIVKVCGMRDAENIRDIESLGVDMMGFIFYPLSPRYAGEVPPGYLPRCIRTGVFVDDSIHKILDIAAVWSLNAVQLHGSESPDVCRHLRACGLKVVKAFGIGGGLPSCMDAYAGCCDMFLFDTACKGHGGSGRRFDWHILKDYYGDTPFLLSGGIGPDSMPDMSRFSHPKWIGVDLNSAFELSPGKKDVDLLRSFLSQPIFSNH